MANFFKTDPVLAQMDDDDLHWESLPMTRGQRRLYRQRANSHDLTGERGLRIAHLRPDSLLRRMG